MDQVLFVAFGALALASSVMAITRRNAVAAAVWLVGTFFGLAGTFVLLEAYFVAVIQILVYAGAIMVLFLFVIMLLDLKREDLISGPRPRLKLPGIVLAALFLFVAGRAIVDAKDRWGAVAPRASALLRLPAPLPTATDPLLGPTETPPAPDPIRVPLSRREPASLPLDAALLESFSRRPVAVAGPDASSEKKAPSSRPRLFAGTVRVGQSDRSVIVPLEFSDIGHHGPWWFAGSAHVDLDGDGVVEADEQLRGSSSQPPAIAEGVWYDASFVAPGAVLDVKVEQGGLAAAPGGAPDGSPFAIGKSLFDDWILPFEVTSLLLLGAIFGAVVLTKRRLG